jgi:ABC-type amino acid transport substrate-binding protein
VTFVGGSVFKFSQASFVLVLFGSVASAETTVKVGVTDFPPYTIEKGYEVSASKTVGNCHIKKGVYHGIDVDYLEAVLKKANIKYTIEYLPYARIKDQMNANAIQMIPGTLYAEDNGKPRYQYVMYDAGGNTLLFKKKGAKINVSKPEDLKNLQIGVVRDDSYGDTFAEAVKAGHIVIKDANQATEDSQNFEKLLNNRIDLLAINNIVGHFLVKSKNLADKVEPIALQFQYGANPKTNGVYFAFNQNVGRNVLLKVSNAVEELQKTKTLECIRMHYGVVSN